MHSGVDNSQDVNFIYYWRGKEQFVTSGVVKNFGGNQKGSLDQVIFSKGIDNKINGGIQAFHIVSVFGFRGN